MKRTLATAGHMAHAAAPRLRAACDAGSAYSWHVTPSINPVTVSYTHLTLPTKRIV